MRKILVIGAGFTGATIARRFAEEGYAVTVLERRSGPGGNAADVESVRGGPFVSLFGPHIFHTSNEEVWKFVTHFSDFIRYDHKVQSLTDIGWVPWPVNKRTIELCYQDDWKRAARHWKRDIEKSVQVEPLTSFGSRARAAVGSRVYDLMLRHYTEKQWHRDPDTVPAEVFGRVRVVMSYDESFFADTHVCFPVAGYSNLLQEMLTHANITVDYNQDVTLDLVASLAAQSWFTRVFSTAAPDVFCNFSHGPLEYLSTQFEPFHPAVPSLPVLESSTWPTPVVNFAQASVPVVRATDYGRMLNRPLQYGVTESPAREGEGNPMYPVRTAANALLATTYLSLLAERGIISTGRLGGFAYINMDEAIRDALVLADAYLGL